MAGPSPDPSPEPGRLDSWKQIAGYLDKSERTVRRWSQTEGLPVHKHLHQQRGSVWAYQHELDAWLAERRVSPEPLVEVPEPQPRPFPWTYLAIAVAVVTVTTAAWFLTHRPPEPLGESVPFTALPGSETSPSFSPDGRKVVFLWNNTIQIKSLDDEKTTPLVTAGGFPFDPAWSPDGKTIAFLRREETRETWLYLISATGGPEQKLALLMPFSALYANHKHISWSPDSQSIVAPTGKAGTRIITISRILLNGDIRPLTDPTDVASLFSAQMAPDGHAFAYLRRKGPSTSVVFSTEVLLQPLSRDGNPDGKPQLIHTADLSPNGFAWAPDARSLVFCTATADNLDSRLFRLPAEPNAKLLPLGVSDCVTVAVSRPDSSGKALLLYGSASAAKSGLLQSKIPTLDGSAPFAPSSRTDTYPSFSPTGQAVAFISNRSGRREVWVAKSDGTEPRRLTSTGNIYSTPEWSPDGNTLVYTTTNSSYGRTVTITPVAGGTPQTASNGGRDSLDPVWSRDGKSIYYVSGPTIWRCRADGTDHAKVFEGAYRTLGESPDGQYLYFLSFRKRDFVLNRIPKNGGSPELLAEGLQKNQVAVTNTAIYFVKPQSGTVHRLPFQGEAATELGPLPNPQGNKGNIIYGLSVSPDDKTLLWSEGEGQQRDLELIRNFR